MTEPSLVSERPSHRATPVLLAVIAAIFLGSVVLVIGMIEEPYHIDELRQVRAYPRPVEKVVALSFGQEQPPLDSLIGKTVYEVVGQGHIRQRLHPTILGMVSLALIASLLWRAGLRWAVPVAVLVYSLVPIVVSVTAYARQYSLPVFLWLVLLNGTELWLHRRRWIGLALATVASFLLPLSRSIEPEIMLAAVVGSLVVWTVRGARARWLGSPMPIIGGAGVSLVVVGIPIVLLIRSEAAEFIAPAVGLGERVSRLATDLPSAVADTSTAWPVALAVLVIAVASPRVRHFASSEWWFWPLLAVPVGFASAFFLLAEASQPFFVRYTYSWWLPFAILSGVVVEEAVDLVRRREDVVRASLGVGAVSLMVVFLSVALAEDLTSDDWVDYEPLGELITAELDRDVVVYFDNLRRLGRYRPGYAGYGRFTRHQVPPAHSVVRNPTIVEPEARFVVALNGPEVEVSGWVPVQASDSMYLYLPEEIPAGYLQAASALLEFGRALDPDTGGMLRLAGASLLVAADQPAAACDEVESLVADDMSLADEVEEAIEGHPLDEIRELCEGDR